MKNKLENANSMIESILYPVQENENIKEMIYYLQKVNKGSTFNIVFWIGAGISKLVGYPLWTELVECLANSYQALSNSNDYKLEQNLELIKDLRNNRDFLKILQIIKSDNEDFYKNEIKKIFKNTEKNCEKDIDIITTIAKFVKKQIVVITTNLDRELENFLNLNDEQISIVPLNKILNSSHKLVYLHGRIDEYDSWIMSEEDYASAYDNEPKLCNKFLDNFLSNINVLVIMGYSLSEKEIYRKFLKSEKNLKIFWIQLIDSSSKEEKFKNQIMYFRQALKLDIKSIPYRESNDLVILLDEIYKRAFEPNIKEVFNNND